MLKAEYLLSRNDLMELLDYDPTTGIFVWKVRTSDRIRIGNVAGSFRSGYRIIRIKGSIYHAHRIAWLFVHGTWPSHDIDHINLVRDDNRISNLREATRSENLRNVAIRDINKSGLKGVSSNKRQYMARICVHGKTFYLGTFDTPEEAHAAYVAASLEHHGEYGRLS